MNHIVEHLSCGYGDAVVEIAHGVARHGCTQQWRISVVCRGRHASNKAAVNKTIEGKGRRCQLIIVTAQQFLTALEPNDAHHRPHELTCLEDWSVTIALAQKKAVVDERSNR